MADTGSRDLRLMVPDPPPAVFYLVWYYTRGGSPHWEMHELSFKSKDEAVARAEWIRRQHGLSAKIVKISL